MFIKRTDIIYIGLLTQSREALQQWIHWCVQSRTVCRGREVADIVTKDGAGGEWRRGISAGGFPDPMKYCTSIASYHTM